MGLMDCSSRSNTISNARCHGLKAAAMCPQLGAGGVVIMTFMAIEVLFHEVVIAAAIGRSGMQAARPLLERRADVHRRMPFSRQG